MNVGVQLLLLLLRCFEGVEGCSGIFLKCLLGASRTVTTVLKVMNIDDSHSLISCFQLRL